MPDLGEPDLGDAAAAVLSLAARAQPRCGPTRVVLIDGPAGSGKTTLAQRLHEEATSAGFGCEVVHMDDLYRGWAGLREGGDALTAMLTTLARGEPASYRRWDWDAGRYAEDVAVDPVALVVVEGVGSVRVAHVDIAAVVVWVEEPDPQERLRRGLRRDGAAARSHWKAWMQQEQDLFVQVRTRERADVIVGGTGELRRR